jgi:hypothetical protein
MTSTDHSVPAARPRRLLFALGIVLVSGLGVGVAMAVASSTGNASGGGFARASFPRYGLLVRYPSSLARVDWCWAGPHVIPITLLTTAHPTPKCTKPVVGVGASFPPAERLKKGGVSVELAFQAVLPGAKVTWNARIDGQPANVARPAYGRKHHTAVTCPTGVRREYRSVAIKRPAAMNQLLTVNAVICGPHLAAGDAALDRILASISFKR